MRTKGFLLALAVSIAGSAMAQVDNAEYFWDTDPGAGSGFAITAVDGAYDQAVEAIFFETSTLPGLGAHTLGMRIQDVNGNWGPTVTTVIMIEPSVVTAPAIVVGQAEYFWDTDPGEGSGVPMVAFDGDYDAALEAIALETTNLPSIGTHVLHLRVRDLDAWSVPFRVVFEVFGGSVSFPDVHLNLAEYYLNEDPGMGNGVPMLTADGNYDSALEAVMGGGIPVPVEAGPNVLWLRAKDANEAWGPSFGVIVNIDTTIFGTVDIPEILTSDDIKLIPNPTSAASGFDVLFPAKATSIRVIDAQGRLVRTIAANSTRTHVDMSGHAPGVYAVGVVLDGIAHWQRVVVE